MAGHNIPRSFARGAVFGAGLAILATGLALATGGTGLFLGASGIGGIVMEFMVGAAGGMAIGGPVFAATDVFVQAVPGLPDLLGANRERRSEVRQAVARGKMLSDPDAKNFRRLEQIEQNILAPDYVHSNHAAQLEAERALEEAQALEAATAQHR